MTKKKETVVALAHQLANQLQQLDRAERNASGDLPVLTPDEYFNMAMDFIVRVRRAEWPR